ncbi:hypothetical protein LCGC14_2303700, partial [marine sediment metagenome]
PGTGDNNKVMTYDETNDRYVFSTPSADSDEKSKVSANDTTAGYLNGKLIAGTGITLTENNNGGNETLSIINNDKGSDAISTHEITYDHTNLHTHANKALLDTYTQTDVNIASAVTLKHAIQHAIDSGTDHTSSITQNNLIDADVNGLPDDSGLAVSDVSDAITKKHTQNTDTKLDNGGANEVSASNLKTKQVIFSLDGAGTALATGEKSWVRVPFSGTIVGWELTADQAGDIVIDIWKDVLGNFPPTVADTIVDGSGAVKPTLSSAQTNSDSSLTGWSATITAGDYLKFNIDSATTVTKIVLILKIEIN